MKKIISILVAVVLCLGISMAAVADEWQLDFSDRFNNGLFDVIGQIKDLDSPDGKDHGEVVDVNFEAVPDKNAPENAVERVFSVYSVTLYADGTRIRDYIADFEGEYVRAKKATNGYPAFLEEPDPNAYVFTDRIFPKSAEEDEVVNIYLVIKDGDDIATEFILSEVWNYTEEGTTVTIRTVSEESGQTVLEELPDVGPIDEYEYRKRCGEYVVGKDYNDGLILKTGEGEYQDINGNCVFATGMLGYTYTGYNLGYYLINSNNGGSVDWSMDDAERQVRHISEFKGMDDENFNFDNADIGEFMDNGYNIMTVKDDAGNEISYLIRLKNPAIVTTVLDGKKIYFDQLPVIESGRTLVPLRAIFEALGADVEWDGTTNTVTATKDDVEIKLTIDSLTASKNGTQIALDVPARVVNGRTLVPVRFVADCFGVDVDWDDTIHQVVLTSK